MKMKFKNIYIIVALAAMIFLISGSFLFFNIKSKEENNIESMYITLHQELYANCLINVSPFPLKLHVVINTALIKIPNINEYVFEYD